MQMSLCKVSKNRKISYICINIFPLEILALTDRKRQPESDWHETEIDVVKRNPHRKTRLEVTEAENAQAQQK